MNKENKPTAILFGFTIGDLEGLTKIDDTPSGGGNNKDDMFTVTNSMGG